MDVKTRETTEILTITTNSLNDVPRLAWSPSGDEIALDIPDDTGEWVIAVLNIENAFLRYITPGRRPSWSCLGDEIVYDYQGAIWSISVETSESLFLTAGDNDKWPSCSPDGKSIVFESARDGNSEIYIISRDGTMPVRLTQNDIWDGKPEWRKLP
jgi:TolB protein